MAMALAIAIALTLVWEDKAPGYKHASAAAAAGGQDSRAEGAERRHGGRSKAATAMGGADGVE